MAIEDDYSQLAAAVNKEILRILKEQNGALMDCAVRRGIPTNLYVAFLRLANAEFPLWVVQAHIEHKKGKRPVVHVESMSYEAGFIEYMNKHALANRASVTGCPESIEGMDNAYLYCPHEGFPRSVEDEDDYEDELGLGLGI